MPAPVGHAFLRRRRRLRAGLAQLLLILGGFGLGLVMQTITRGPQVPGRPVTDMLLAVGLGVLGAVAVIFSLLFLVVQWAATTFTPRLTLFRDDPIVWRTFACSIGLAVFAITTALSIGSTAEVSAFVPGIALLLLLAMLALLRTLQLRAFAAIQLAPALSSIGGRGRAVLEAVYPAVGPSVGTGAGDGGETRPGAPLPPVQMTLTWPYPPVVLQHVRVEQLLLAARAADSVIALHAVPGTTMQCGAPVADVRGADVSGAALPAAAILGTLVYGNERTFDQDPLFAFRLLADIALRALSPAVNDPATAVQALDELEDLLDRASAVSTEPLRVFDGDGALRVVVALPGWEDFVRTGLDDTIAAAAASPMTLIRLRILLERVRSRSQPIHRQMLTARLAWVDELGGHFPHLGPHLGPRLGDAGSAH